MTESNFATSSARAAVNIVLTVSTTCFWSEMRLFSWALTVETLGEKIMAEATANAIGSCDDMGKNLLTGKSNKHARFLFIPYVEFSSQPLPLKRAEERGRSPLLMAALIGCTVLRGAISLPLRQRCAREQMSSSSTSFFG